MPDEVVAESMTGFTEQMAPSHSVIKYRIDEMETPAR
jgi:hypothetical protein